jgi:hypothetical protein
MGAMQEATDSGAQAQQGLLGRQEEPTTRTSIRLVMQEEILQALKKRAEECGVSVTTLAVYYLTRAVIGD